MRSIGSPEVPGIGRAGTEGQQVLLSKSILEPFVAKPHGQGTLSWFGVGFEPLPFWQIEYHATSTPPNWASSHQIGLGTPDPAISTSLSDFILVSPRPSILRRMVLIPSPST